MKLVLSDFDLRWTPWHGKHLARHASSMHPSVPCPAFQLYTSFTILSHVPAVCILQYLVRHFSRIHPSPFVLHASSMHPSVPCLFSSLSHISCRCQLLTIKTRVRFQGSPFRIYGGHCGNGTAFCATTLDFPRHLSCHQCFLFIHLGGTFTVLH